MFPLSIPSECNFACVLQCTATCGQGVMSRLVVCRDALGHVTDVCDPQERPESTQTCTAPLECPITTPTTTTTAPNRPPREKGGSAFYFGPLKDSACTSALLMHESSFESNYLSFAWPIGCPSIEISNRSTI